MHTERKSQSVLVVSSSKKSYEIFNEMLSLGSFSEISAVTNCVEAKRILCDRNYDIIIINSPLQDDFGLELAIEASEDSAAGVMLLVKGDCYEQVSYEAEAHGIFTISKPTNKQIIYEALKLLIATNMRLRKYEKKTASLSAKMDEIRIVNHAKWVLIKKLGLSEEDAHRAIEKQAMDTRQSKREIAETIIRTYEN
ncbi:MAG: ANTAR domain-containing protein [Bacillota bacterium]|nr:ANTAR domain-containing protein [Bacillota bacterium]